MLDPLLLRSFVTVVEAGSFTRAGERLHLTQSTISQQIIRLEQSLGCRLLDRSQRQIWPTEAGERLLGYARRILRLEEEARHALSPQQSEVALRLGVPDDFAGEILTTQLSHLLAERPRMRLEVECGLSLPLLHLYRNGELDLLLVKQWGADGDCHAYWPEPLAWVASAIHPIIEPVPLVVFPVGALYRQEMIHALEAAGRPWRISYSSTSLASISAAVSAGLGVSLIPARSVETGHRVLTTDEGFAPITGLTLALYARPALDDDGVALRDSLEALCTRRAAS
uniref:LysR substrate-binding domain-containing protein n=1 Tax=Pseudomonas laurentiana TaxID=2364649 RepID=UPI0029C7B2C2|nr:LysR substrate-binding domain-containing protein [Pseudomonas laurentiana]